MRVRKTPMKPPGTTAAQADEAARQRFMSLVRERLSELYDYVRHELAAREAVGNLVPDDLTPDDVVDDVILRAYREFVRNPEEQPGDDWLRRLAKERIRSEVRRRRWEREHGMHIEDDIPETSPSEDAAMLGEQILYFHQPDEDLRVEDVIQDQVRRCRATTTTTTSGAPSGGAWTWRWPSCRDSGGARWCSDT
jgi:DNA-directed RNA polymerase specialized sigma24 family protein